MTREDLIAQVAETMCVVGIDPVSKLFAKFNITDICEISELDPMHAAKTAAELRQLRGDADATTATATDSPFQRLESSYERIAYTIGHDAADAVLQTFGCSDLRKLSHDKHEAFLAALAIAKPTPPPLPTTAMRNWKRALPAAPCPICQDVQGCTFSKSEVLCQRIESDRPNEDDDCDPGWLHSLDSAAVAVAAGFDLVERVSVFRRAKPRDGTLFIAERVSPAWELKHLLAVGLAPVGAPRGIHTRDEAVQIARGLDVVVIADNHATGATATRDLIENLLPGAKSVRLDTLLCAADCHPAEWWPLGSYALEAMRGEEPKHMQVLIDAAQLQRPSKGPLPVLSMRELVAMPTRRWLVPGLIAKGEQGTVFGPSGSFKSFFTTALATAVAEGSAFLGRRVQQGIAVIICGEGTAGMPKRVRATVGVERMADPCDPIHNRLLVMPVMPAITKRVEFERLVLTLKSLPEPPVLIVFDTWHRLLGACGLDENSAADVGEVITALDRLRDLFPESVVLVVHHTGAGSHDRERGSTALPAAADFRMMLERVGGRTELRARLSIEKQKDAKPAAPMLLAFEEVVVGPDDDGGKVTSLRLASSQPASSRDGDGAQAGKDGGLANVLRLLTEDGPKLGKDLLKLIPGARSTKYERLKQWAADGKLGQQDGFYTAPAESK